MIKLFIYIQIICFSIVISYGQSNRVDSLSNELKNAKHDTTRVRLLNELTVISFKDSATAFNYCRSALDISQKLNYIEGQALATYYIGSTYLVNGVYPKAIKYYKESQSLFLLEQNDFRLMKTHLNIGSAYFYMGQRDSAITNYHHSLIICRQIGDTTHLLMNLENLATLYDSKEEEYNAIPCIEEAIRIREKPKYSNGKANLLLVKGNIHNSTGDFEQALSAFQEGLTSTEKQKDSTMMALFYYSIGFVHDKLNNTAEALTYIKNALELNTLRGEDSKQILCLNGLSTMYVNQGEDSLALTCLKEAKQIAERINSDVERADVQYSLGQYYSDKAPQTALSYYNNALEIRQKIRLLPEVASCYARIADVYNASNQFNLALENAMLAYEIRKDHARKDQLINSLQQLANIYASLKDFKTAFDFHVQYKGLQDSIFSNEKIKAITALEMQHKFDKERQLALSEQQKMEVVKNEEDKRQRLIRNTFVGGFIVMLLIALGVFRSYQLKRRANQELARQKNEIKKQADELKVVNIKQKELVKIKDKFFSIIAHDLRGPLGNLYNLGELLLLSHEELQDERKKVMMEAIVQDAKASYGLLDNLLNWACSNSDNLLVTPVKIGVREITNEVIDLLENTAKSKEIELINAIKHNWCIYADYNMISTVLRNLIANAVKFTPVNGRVEISAELDVDIVKVTVTDTGVGMSSEVMATVFDRSTMYSTPGTIREKGTGLGLILSKEFIDRNKGEIGVESQVGVGTKIWISLPLGSS
ncbi:tetratricopeptide repeat protein [Carboxylicivirga sp. RSCT41]|uniref:tetratricopeptide repeat-containing sensor histidine kinase n=1 Tax=Carboxylicivirga agarovorans TaxID=3417570 RepID=UPI003D350743